MALEKITMKDLPQAYRTAFTRAQEVIRNGSYEYGVELLKDILKARPGFWEAREAIRDAQREKTEHLGGFGKFLAGFAMNKFLIKGKALLKKSPLEALQCAEEALSKLYSIPGLKLAADAALELELPDPTQHADSASWQAASDAFLARFSALLQPDEGLRASMSRTLQLLGPDGEKQLKALAGDMADSPQALLQRAGMRPDNAERLLTMLEQAPDDPDELDAYARELEMAATDTDSPWMEGGIGLSVREGSHLLCSRIQVTGKGATCTKK